MRLQGEHDICNRPRSFPTKTYHHPFKSYLHHANSFHYFRNLIHNILLQPFNFSASRLISICVISVSPFSKIYSKRLKDASSTHDSLARQYQSSNISFQPAHPRNLPSPPPAFRGQVFLQESHYCARPVIIPRRLQESNPPYRQDALQQTPRSHFWLQERRPIDQPARATRTRANSQWTPRKSSEEELCSRERKLRGRR